MWQLSELPNPSPYLPQRSGYSHQLKCIRSNRIFEGGGAALFHRAKWCPEVSSCHLMTGKSSLFIPCIYLTTLTHFDWTSGVRIASYSRRLKCIRSNRIFEGGGAALFHRAKWRPEVSSCHLMTGKSSIFIPCIYLTMLTQFDWTSGVRIASYSHRRSLKCPTTTRGLKKKRLDVLDQRRRSNSSSQHCSLMEMKFLKDSIRHTLESDS